jgi:hypothetical protein
MPKITVAAASGSSFRVTVEEAGTRTVHDVRVTPDDIARYAPGTMPGRLVKASMRFLLDREPKEAILQAFDLPTIERHFPEYPATIRELL